MTRKERQSVVYTQQNENLLPVDLPTFTVANALDPANNEGRVIYVTNGAAGSAVVAFSDGTDWLRVDTLAAITAS